MANVDDHPPIWPGGPNAANPARQTPQRKGAASGLFPIALLGALVVAVALVLAALRQPGLQANLPVSRATATSTPIVVAAVGCTPVPADYTSGARLYVIGSGASQSPFPTGGPAGGPSGGPSLSQVHLCGIGFAPQSQVEVSLSAYRGAPFIAARNPTSSDANGAFSAMIAVPTSQPCGGIQSEVTLRAVDAKGASAVLQIAWPPRCAQQGA